MLKNRQHYAPNVSEYDSGKTDSFVMTFFTNVLRLEDFRKSYQTISTERCFQ